MVLSYKRTMPAGLGIQNTVLLLWKGLNEEGKKPTPTLFNKVHQVPLGQISTQ